MLDFMIETVLMAFVLGGIVGAVVALHLSRRHEPREARLTVHRTQRRNYY